MSDKTGTRRGFLKTVAAGLAVASVGRFANAERTQELTIEWWEDRREIVVRGRIEIDGIEHGYEVIDHDKSKLPEMVDDIVTYFEKWHGRPFTYSGWEQLPDELG